MNKSIIGSGSWARVVSSLTGINKFYVEDGFTGGLPLSSLNENDNLIIAIANPKVRNKLYNKLKNHKFISYRHPSALCYDDSILNWKECFVAPNCVFTINISIGKQCQLNIGTVMGHDVTIGNFFTTSPKVFIAGNVTIGDNVFIGAGALIREKINICSDVTIGMGSVVVKDITEPGIYVGNPLRKIK